MQIFIRVNNRSSKTYVYSYDNTTELKDLLQWLGDQFGITHSKYYWMRQGSRIISKNPEDYTKRIADSILEEQTVYIEPRFHATSSD